jgi:hypothetical protein
MQYDPKELAAGTKIEGEHTKDVKLAQKIAMDHLAEDPHYYTKLKAAGLEEEGALNPVEAGMAECGETPQVVIISPDNIAAASQVRLSSSDLGSGVPKKLSTTNLEAPETKVINDKNTVSYGKTPAIGHTADPINHFCGLAVDETRKSNYDGDGNIKMA